MLYDEKPIPFTWYDNIKKQNRFKPNGPDYAVTQLMAPNDRLLPFQFSLAISLMVPEYFKIFNIEGDLIEQLETNNLKKAIFNNLDFVYFKANEPLQIKDSEDILELVCGEYYAEIKINGRRFFSEVFTASDNLNNNPEYLLLEWSSGSSIFPVYYGDGYADRLYLKSFITDGEQLIENETEKNGLNSDIIISQSFKETWEISAGLVPYFIKRALGFMSISPNIILQEFISGRFGNIYNVKLKPTSEYGKSLTEIDIIFDMAQDVFRSTCDGLNIPEGGEEGGPDGFDGIIDDGENNDELNYIDI